MRIRGVPRLGRLPVILAAAAPVLVPAGLVLGFYLRGRDGSQRVAGLYQIFTEDPGTKRQHVYHTKDTGWEVPFYFKFESADLQSEAASITGEAARDGHYAVITSYGWRINLLSMFPNVVSIRRASRHDAPVPWSAIAILAASTAGTALRYRRRLHLRIPPPDAVRRVPD